MNIIFETLNKAGLRFIEFASPMLIQSSILILILLAADFLLRKKVRAIFRYCIWMLVLIKLILPVSLYSPLSLGSWFGEKIEYANLTQEDTGQRAIKSENTLFIKPDNSNFRTIEPRVESSESVPSIPHTIATNPLPTSSEQVVIEKPVKLSWQAAAFVIWIAVTAALGLVLLKRTVFIKELITKASDIDFSQNNSISPNDILKHCCISLGLKKQIPLKISPDATSPVVCGLLRPVILLPQNLISSLNPGQLKAIFFHELAHIKRGDLWVNLLQTLLQITYFYNPLLWLANSIIRRTREQAVDETVLVAMGKDADQYPETLLNVAKLAFKRPALSLRLIGVVESKNALSDRIKHMLSRPLPKNAKLGIIGLVVIIITAAILLPMGKKSNLDYFVDTTKGYIRCNSDISELGRVLVNMSYMYGFKQEFASSTGFGSYESPVKYTTTNYIIPENKKLSIEAVAEKNQPLIIQIDLEPGALYSLDEITTELARQLGIFSKATSLINKSETSMSIELLGVSEHPGEGNQWWKPDGSLLKERPYGTIKEEQESRGKEVNGVNVRLGGEKPLGLFYGNNTLSFEVQNNSRDTIEINTQPYAQKETENAKWGYLEMLDTKNKPIEYKWNAENNFWKIKPSETYKVHSFANGRPLRNSGPGTYKAQITLVVRNVESDQTFEIQSNWHEFEITPCGYAKDFLPETPYEELQQAEAYQSMIGYGYSTIEQVIGMYENIIQKYPNSKYELKAHFGIAVTASEDRNPESVTESDYAMSRKHYQEIIKKWPDVVTYDTIHARYQAYFQTPEFQQSRLELHEWLTSLATEQKINSIKKYFIFPYKPTEEDVQRTLKALDNNIKTYVGSLERNLNRMENSSPNKPFDSQGAPIIGYDVKLNFADPSIRDDSFYNQQRVAFVLSFQQIEGMLAGKGTDFITTGQETWPVIVNEDTLTISNGSSGQQIMSESWPSEKTKFEKVITLPLEYSGNKYQCPVYVELQRRENNFPTGNYWFCAYLSGRLPWGSGGRIFEIVNLDQQMEFRLTGDGTDKRDAVLGIDINGDGKIDPSETGGEQFSLYEPFTINSKTYRVTEVDPYLPRVVFCEVEIAAQTNSAAENTEHDSLSISYEYAELENINVSDGTLEYIWHTLKKDLNTEPQSKDSYDKHEFKKKLSEDEIKLFEKWIEDCNVFRLPTKIPKRNEETYGSAFITNIEVNHNEKNYKTDWTGDSILTNDITTAIQNLKDITNEIKDKSDKPWGQEIEKIQIRVRMDQQLHEGQIPKFLVDVRNNGTEDLRLVLAPEWWELELDGLWYKVGTWYSGIVPVMSLDSSEQKNGIEFVPDENWDWNNNSNPLKFLEGTHEARLLHTVFRKDPNDKRSTRVLSNPIEFEILPKEEKSEAKQNINVNEIKPLPSDKIDEMFERIINDEEIDLLLIYQSLIKPQTALRADAARYLGTHGDSNSIPYLIDALSDESTHVGRRYSDMGMFTTRYWANDSLKKLTGLDVGFAWNDPIEKRNKAIQKWKYWWEKNEFTFQVINNNDREEIENIVGSLWQAVDSNDTKKVSQLYYDKIIDNNDSNTNGLIHGLLKDKEQVEKLKGNDIASISNIVIRNNLAIAVTKPNIEALFIYYFVKPDDKWFLYYTERRTNLSKIIDLEPTIAINDLFNNWPRTKLDNEAGSAYLNAGKLLHEGTERTEVAKKFKSIGELYPLTDRGKICTELGKLLDEMVQEDKKFVEPSDIERLSEKEKIDYYIYKLRDVAEQEMFIPGKCYVLRFPRTPDSAAVALRNMGSVVISSMISLLEDRRPTRSVGLSLNGGVVLRYCDIALEIVADIAGQNNPNETTIFDPRTQRGAYLSSADEEVAQKIIQRAKSWWEQNKDKYDLSSEIR